MENAVEAIMMAFAVIVLILALSVSIFSFNKVRVVSDIVLYSKDETNYYDYQGAIGAKAENRIVGIETIIPTLYKYYKENYTVVFRQASYNDETGELTNIKPLKVYETPSNSALWQSNYKQKLNDKYSRCIPAYSYDSKPEKEIFSFDIEEETLRHEPWTGSNEQVKENLNYFLNGGKYINPNNNIEYIDYGYGFIDKYKNAKFVENIGEYEYSSSKNTEDGSSISTNVKNKKKRIIIFTEIN